MMAQQPEGSWRAFEFVISDTSGVTISFDFADSVRSDIDVIRAIAASRPARNAGLEAWLAGAPSITCGAVTFRPDGAVLPSGTIPWSSLDRIEVAHVDQPLGGGMYIHFVPSKESGLRRKFTRIGSGDLHEFYAELDFWRARFSIRSGEGRPGAAAPAASPRKAVTCFVVAAVTVIVVVVLLLVASRIAGRRARADTGMIHGQCGPGSVQAVSVLPEKTSSLPPVPFGVLPPAGIESG
jgi:hypothetical protein